MQKIISVGDKCSRDNSSKEKIDPLEVLHSSKDPILYNANPYDSLILTEGNLFQYDRQEKFQDVQESVLEKDPTPLFDLPKNEVEFVLETENNTISFKNDSNDYFYGLDPDDGNAFDRVFIDSQILEMSKQEEDGIQDYEESLNENNSQTASHNAHQSSAKETTQEGGSSFDTRQQESDSDESYVPDPARSDESGSDEHERTDAVEPKNNATLSIKRKKKDIELSTFTQGNDDGNLIPRLKFTHIKTSSDGPKVYACFYCGKLLQKIARHLTTVHAEEKVVELINSSTIKSDTRISLLNELRESGNFKHNRLGTGENRERILARRPSKGKMRDPDYYEYCPTCGKSLAKTSLRVHYKTCSGVDGRNHRTIKSLARKLSDNYHTVASPVLRHILSKLSDDEVGISVRYDKLIVTYGNLLAIKYRPERNYEMIRQRVRILGRLVIAVKKINRKIEDLTMIFHPQNFNVCIEAINYIAGLKDDGMTYSSPAVAAAIGTLLEQTSKVLIGEYIRSRDKVKKEEVEDFMKLKEESWTALVGKNVAESQSKKRRQKKIELPSTGDIETFMNFLEEKREHAYTELVNEFSVSPWLELAETTLLTTQIFNRRRAGETQRIEIADFEANERIDESNHPDIFMSLDSDAKKKCQEYVRFGIRGKLSRDVAVILDKDMLNCFRAIISFRINAGVDSENPYVFGSPGSAKYKSHHLDACTLMRTYSSQSGASCPKTLRGTELRKHLATNLNTFNSENINRNTVADHLGHDIAIHKNYYQIPNVGKDIIQMTPVLEKASRRTKNNYKKSDFSPVPPHEEFPEEDTFEEESHRTDSEQPMNTNNTQNDADSIGNSHSSDSKCTPFEDMRDQAKNAKRGGKRKLPSGIKGLSSTSFENIGQAKNIKRKLAKTSAIRGPVKKRERWTDAENTAMRDIFSMYIQSRTYPTFDELSRIKSLNNVFQNREPAVMKTWFSNLYTKIGRAKS